MRVAVDESWLDACRELPQTRFKPIAPGDQIVPISVGESFRVLKTAPCVADRIPLRQLQRWDAEAMECAQCDTEITCVGTRFVWCDVAPYGGKQVAVCNGLIDALGKPDRWRVYFLEPDTERRNLVYTRVQPVGAGDPNDQPCVGQSEHRVVGQPE